MGLYASPLHSNDGCMYGPVGISLASLAVQESGVGKLAVGWVMTDGDPY
jgi:hypothetical protein